MDRSVWIGYDKREATAFAVAKYSVRQFDRYIPINALIMDVLREKGLYTRPTIRKINSEGREQLWDVISDHWMSTEHSLTRFLVPHLAKTGWALFVDSDIIVKTNLYELFNKIDQSKALMCVKHNHNPESSIKMDGQVQSKYDRKNWSSVMIFNCDHPKNKLLTPEVVNTLTGRDLHAFSWLNDGDIGALPPEWNYLVGHSKTNGAGGPKLVHFTSGLPDMAGYEKQEFADEWWDLVPRAVGAM